MFKGFTNKTSDFLKGIRENNNKEWFTENKTLYTENVYEPLKQLGEELFAPFADTEGMMYKVSRIYRDAYFPPYLHYRDTMYIYIRYEAVYWNKTPTLFFEISPDGAEYGFRIANPDAKVMECFRRRLTENPGEFLDIINRLEEKYGVIVSGEEYKRMKPCTVPEAERFFMKKGLTVSVKIPCGRTLYSKNLVKKVSELFRELVPLNDFFHNIVQTVENEKNSTAAEEIPVPMVKAPRQDFMW